MPNPRRKHVLLLLEGLSDAQALYHQLKSLIERVDPKLKLHPIIPSDNDRSHDLTVEDLDDPRRIEGLINKVYIQDFMERYSLLPKDIVRVIQIVDMDGAYVLDRDVLPGTGRPVYLETGIHAEHVEGIRHRNQVKRRNLNYLSTISRIQIYGQKECRDGAARAKPYGIYYFSCNLDHFLHGDANIEATSKCSKAKEFARKCEADPTYFETHFMQEAELFGRQVGENGKIITPDYKASWDFIREGRRSLEPHSNLCVLIDELKKAGC